MQTSGLISQVSHGVLIIDFQETTILDQAMVDTIGQELQDLAASTKVNKILVDMNRIELMTSAMVGQFINFNKKATDRGITVHFCNLTSEISQLFRITRLDSVFTIHQTREEAIKAFG